MAEDIQELERERQKKIYLIGDIRDMIMVIEKIDNNSREEIIEFLLKKEKELRSEAESLLTFIQYKLKGK